MDCVPGDLKAHRVGEKPNFSLAFPACPDAHSKHRKRTSSRQQPGTIKRKSPAKTLRQVSTGNSRADPGNDKKNKKRRTNPARGASRHPPRWRARSDIPRGTAAGDAWQHITCRFRV
jgi:hypothetical protein